MRVLITASTRLTMMDWGPRSRTSNELSRSAACVGVIDRGHSLRWALPRSQCAFRGRGLNRSAVGKTAISTSGRPQSLASPTLTSLVACTSALRRAILGHGDARGRPRSLPSYYGRPAPFPARAPYPTIQSTLKQRPCQSRLRPPRLYTQGRRGRGEAAVGHGLAYTRFCRQRSDVHLCLDP
jgi:hypothetical protein